MFTRWEQIDAGRLLIAIDAVDALEDGHLTLRWLPSALPSKVQLVLSSHSSRSTALLEGVRGWHHIRMLERSSPMRVVLSGHLDLQHCGLVQLAAKRFAQLESRCGENLVVSRCFLIDGF